MALICTNLNKHCMCYALVTNDRVALTFFFDFFPMQSLRRPSWTSRQSTLTIILCPTSPPNNTCRVRSPLRPIPSRPTRESNLLKARNSILIFGIQRSRAASANAVGRPSRNVLKGLSSTGIVNCAHSVIEPIQPHWPTQRNTFDWAENRVYGEIPLCKASGFSAAAKKLW